MNKLILLLLIIPITACSYLPSAVNTPYAGTMPTIATSVPTASIPDSGLAQTPLSLTPLPITLPQLSLGNVNLRKPAAGLEKLEGYSASLTISFKGTQDGNPVDFTQVYTRQVSRHPGANLSIVVISGTITPTQVLAADVEGNEYFQMTKGGPCTVRPANTAGQNVAMLEPAALLQAVNGAQAAGEETIGQIQASAAKFDEHAIGLSGRATAEGELWTAKEGGWLAKYSLTVAGGEDYFGKGMSGQETWQYILTDVNAPPHIQVPAGCPALLTGLPVLQNAAQLQRLPSYISYQTTSSLAEATDFYIGQMKAQQWNLIVNSNPKGTNISTTLFFTNSTDQDAMINLDPSANGLSITIQIIETTTRNK